MPKTIQRTTTKKRRAGVQPEVRTATLVGREITVTVSRTVQIKQYEPSYVSVTDKATLAEEDANDPALVRATRSAIYSSLSKAVVRMVNNEIEVHGNLED